MVRGSTMFHQHTISMESINYTLLNKPVKLSKIESDYQTGNSIYFSVEKASGKEHIYFFNPEYAFEKQLLTNADATKAFTYLKAAERFPQEYEKFKEQGFVVIRMDNDLLNIFVRHISV